MSDLVERLRAADRNRTQSCLSSRIFNEAAATITRLEAELAEAHHLARHRKQSAGEPVAWMYQSHVGTYPRIHRGRQTERYKVGWTEKPLYEHPPTPATVQADAVDRVARILAPRLEGGREFDQMAVNSRELKIRVSDGTGWPNDATQEHAIEAAQAVIAAIQSPDVAALADDAAITRMQEAYATFGQSGHLRTTPPSRGCILVMLAAMKGNTDG